MAPVHFWRPKSLTNSFTQKSSARKDLILLIRTTISLPRQFTSFHMQIRAPRVSVILSLNHEDFIPQQMGGLLFGRKFDQKLPRPFFFLCPSVLRSYFVPQIWFAWFYYGFFFFFGGFGMHLRRKNAASKPLLRRRFLSCIGQSENVSSNPGPSTKNVAAPAAVWHVFFRNSHRAIGNSILVLFGLLFFSCFIPFFPIPYT